MSLYVALILVVALGAVLMLPKKTLVAEPHTPLILREGVAPTHALAHSISLRQQQLSEESSAIARAYEQRAQDAWIAETIAKATDLFNGPSEEDEE